MKNILKGCALVLALVGFGWAFAPVHAGPSSNAKYIGSRNCKACHYKENRAWRNSPHAKAFKALPEKNTQDAECLKCHTTGFGKPGGFVSVKKTPELMGIGCESCHGAGSEHRKAALEEIDNEEKIANSITKKMDNVCIRCHNPHTGKGPSSKD